MVCCRFEYRRQFVKSSSVSNTWAYFYIPSGEKILVCVHKQALADGGAGLLRHEVCQPRSMQAEPASAESNRTR